MNKFTSVQKLFEKLDLNIVVDATNPAPAYIAASWTYSLDVKTKKLDLGQSGKNDLQKIASEIVGQTNGPIYQYVFSNRDRISFVGINKYNVGDNKKRTQVNGKIIAYTTDAMQKTAQPDNSLTTFNFSGTTAIQFIEIEAAKTDPSSGALLSFNPIEALKSKVKAAPASAGATGAAGTPEKTFKVSDLNTPGSIPQMLWDSLEFGKISQFFTANKTPIFGENNAITLNGTIKVGGEDAPETAWGIQMVSTFLSMLGFGAPKTAGKQPYNTQLESVIQTLLRESGDPEYKQNPNLLYRDVGNKIGPNTASKIVELGFIYILNNSSQFKSYFPPNNTILTDGRAGPALNGYIDKITDALDLIRGNAQEDTGGSGGSGSSTVDGSRVDNEALFLQIMSGIIKGEPEGFTVKNTIPTEFNSADKVKKILVDVIGSKPYNNIFAAMKKYGGFEKGKSYPNSPGFKDFSDLLIAKPDHTTYDQEIENAVIIGLENKQF